MPNNPRTTSANTNLAKPQSGDHPTWDEGRIQFSEKRAPGQTPNSDQRLDSDEWISDDDQDSSLESRGTIRDDDFDDIDDMEGDDDRDLDSDRN